MRIYPGCKAMLKAALKAPDRWTYSDLGISPPKADEFDSLDLYHATAGGEAALNRKYRDDAIRAHTWRVGEPPIQSAPGEMLIEAAE